MVQEAVSILKESIKNVRLIPKMILYVKLSVHLKEKLKVTLQASL